MLEVAQSIFVLELNMNPCSGNDMLVIHTDQVKLHSMILRYFLVRSSMFECDFVLYYYRRPFVDLHMVAVEPNHFYQRPL